MKDTLMFHLDLHWDHLFPNFSKGPYKTRRVVEDVAKVLDTAWPEIQNAVTIMGISDMGCSTTIKMKNRIRQKARPYAHNGLHSGHFRTGQDLMFRAISDMLTSVTPSGLNDSDPKHFKNKTINVINPYLVETSGGLNAPILRTSPGHVNVFHIVASPSYGVRFKDVYLDQTTNKVVAKRGDNSGFHNFLIGNPIRALTWFYNYVVSGFEDPRIRIAEVPTQVAADVLKRLKPQNNEYSGLRVCDSQSFNSIEFTINSHTPRETFVYKTFIGSFKNLRTVSRTVPKKRDPRDGTCYTIEAFLKALGIQPADGYFGMLGGLVSSTKMPQSMKNSMAGFEKYSTALDLLETQERKKDRKSLGGKGNHIVQTFLNDVIWHSTPIIYKLLRMLHRSSSQILLLHKNNLIPGYDTAEQRRRTDDFVLYSIFEYPWYEDVIEIMTDIRDWARLGHRSVMKKHMSSHSRDSKSGQSVRYFKGFMSMPTRFTLARPTWSNTGRFAASYITSYFGEQEKWVWRDDMTLEELFRYVLATVEALSAYMKTDSFFARERKRKEDIRKTSGGNKKRKKRKHKNRRFTKSEAKQRKKHRDDDIVEILRTLGLVHSLFRPLHDAVTSSELKDVKDVDDVDQVPSDMKPDKVFKGSNTRDSEVYNFLLSGQKTVPIGPYTEAHNTSRAVPGLRIHKDKYASVGTYKPKNDKYGKLIRNKDIFMGGLSGTTRDELRAVLGLAPVMPEAHRWGFLLSYMGFAYVFKFHSVSEVFHQAANFLVPLEALDDDKKLKALTNMHDATSYVGTDIKDVIEVFESELEGFDTKAISQCWAKGYLSTIKVTLPPHFED